MKKFLKRLATGLFGGLVECIRTGIFFFVLFWIDANTDNPVWAAAWIGLGVGLMVLQSKSEGHLNPAISAGAAIGLGLSIWTAAWLIVMHVVGACLAVAASVYTETGGLSEAAVREMRVKPAPGVGVWEAFLKEAGLTCGFVIVALAFGKRKEPWAPWVIAGTLAFCVWFIVDETGAALNPARAIAPFIVSTSIDGFGYAWKAYMAGPIVGGLAGGVAVLSFFMLMQSRNDSSPSPE